MFSVILTGRSQRLLDRVVLFGMGWPLEDLVCVLRNLLLNAIVVVAVIMLRFGSMSDSNSTNI